MWIFLDIFLLLPIAWIVGELFKKIKMPKLLGYLIVGIVAGNVYATNGMSLPLNEHIKIIAKVCLSVILLKAGLGISEKALKKVGKRALLLGIFPNLFEGFTILLFSWWLLDFDFYAAGMLGFAVSAVSPAVVIPSMTSISEKGYGQKSGITTMNLTSASLDDVVSLTIFAIFANLANDSENSSIAIIASREPISILTGILIGLVFGNVLARIYKPSLLKHIRFLQFILVIVIMSGLFFLDYYHLWVSMTMAIMVLGFAFANKNEKVKNYFVKYTGNIWYFAQILLFFLIGSKVNFISNFDWKISLWGVLIIFIGLLVRLSISYLCLIGSHFNQKERLFNMIANIPKATIQATVAPLVLGLTVFDFDIINITVLSILITAPLGLILIETTYKKWLDKPKKLIK